MSNRSQNDMEQETVFIEGDLPEGGSEDRQGVWKRRLAPLMTEEGTGKWAQVFITSVSQARTYKWSLSKADGGLQAPKPEEGFAFTFAARTVTIDGEQKGVVYAKYAAVEADADTEADTEADSE